MARGKAYEKLMTPTEQDKELRELLYENREDHARARRLLVNGNINVGDCEKLEKVADSRAIEAITADRKRVALEAELKGRILELDNVGEWAGSSAIGDRWDNRMAELKAKQEEV